MSFAISSGEVAIGAQMRAAILEGVTGLSQMLEAIIHGDDLGDFIAHLLARFTFEERGALRISGGRDFAKNFVDTFDLIQQVTSGSPQPEACKQ